MFFFQAQKFHLSLFNKKTTLSYFFFIGEILIVGLIAYFLYQFVLPSANIYVKPSYTVEDIVYNFRYYPARNDTDIKDSSFISIPYYTGELHYTYVLKTNVQNMSFLQTPSRGTVKLINTTPNSISLKANTKLVTPDGLYFVIPSSITIPAATNEGSSELIVQVVAMEKDEAGSIIGAKGNIAAGTQLLIRNLPQSYFNKLIYAVAEDAFTGGSTEQHGSITEADLEQIRSTMGSYVRSHKKQIVQEQFANDERYPLPFQSLIDVRVDKVTFDAQPGQEKAEVQGSIEATYIVRYFTRKELHSALQLYLGQRPSQTLDIISMQKNSLTFFPAQDKPVTGDRVITMPTKMSVIRGYDFSKDYNGVKEDMKSAIIGKKKDEAQQLLLGYEEIGSTLIKISPPRSDMIPSIRSRVRFIVSEE